MFLLSTILSALLRSAGARFFLLSRARSSASGCYFMIGEDGDVLGDPMRFDKPSAARDTRARLHATHLEKITRVQDALLELAADGRYKLY